MSLEFEVLARQGAARRGRLDTPHGAVDTPAFMPVGTLGAVKGLGPAELEAAGAEVMLANLYHLALRPGVEAIEAMGGLHAFSGWRRPILTDSGGYQVFSLAARARVDADGVSFRSHLDGEPLRLTPEGVVASQLRLGVDLAMVLDECPPWPVERAAAAAALDRTQEWARRSRAAWPGGPGGLLGIVQGSVYPELRERAARELAAMEFDGYAIGGVSVGEPLAERRAVVERITPLLPADRPRYLMGVGTPADLAHAVACGVDLFDCVLPSRNARHGVLFTRRGVLKIRNGRFRADPRPPDPDCGCPVCRRVSRAFLHHLTRAGELTGAVLATQHNLRFYLDFMAGLREAISFGTLEERVAAATASEADPDADPDAYRALRPGAGARGSEPPT